MQRSISRTATLCLVLAVLAVLAGLLAAGCRASSPQAKPPATPEELALRLFGQPREGTQEPGVYQAEVDASGEFTVKVRCALANDDAVSQSRKKLLELFRDGFAFANVSAISVQIDFPFTDAAGNLSLEPGLAARMTRQTASGIDWTNLSHQDLPEAVDEWWLDERLGS